MLYGEHNKDLIRDFGIDLGSLPLFPGGMYADTAYLMCKLISDPFVRRTFEAGAGISTMLMATISEKVGKQFVSMEDKPEWADRTNQALVSRKSPFKVISTDSDKENCPVFEEPFDLVWIDGNIGWHPKKGIPHNCCHRPGVVRYYQDVMRDAVIMFDDGQDAHCLVEIKKVMSEMERDPEEMWLSNPTNRKDRHQLISLPSPDHPAGQLIKEMGHWYPVADLPPFDGRQ